MKTALLFLGTALVAGAAGAPPRPTAGANLPATPTDDRLASFGTDYKKPQVLAETFFNPFKIQAAPSLGKKEGAGVTTEAIVSAISLRGVSGIIFPAGAGERRAIIGDQVFGVGDELTFPNGDKADFVPLVAGATVVLREVGKDRLGFDVNLEGEAGRHVNFPLRNFWRQ